jgi:hypothetical protein
MDEIEQFVELTSLIGKGSFLFDGAHNASPHSLSFFGPRLRRTGAFEFFSADIKDSVLIAATAISEDMSP